MRTKASLSSLASHCRPSSSESTGGGGGGISTSFSSMVSLAVSPTSGRDTSKGGGAAGVVLLEFSPFLLWARGGRLASAVNNNSGVDLVGKLVLLPNLTSTSGWVSGKRRDFCGNMLLLGGITIVDFNLARLREVGYG